MTIYKLFSLGQSSLTDKLISKGYGSTSGGTCERCLKPLKRYPWYNENEVDNHRLCGLCYMAKIEVKHELKNNSTSGAGTWRQ